ncbi:hydrogenase expression/formation protein HypE [Risungbinella massiliensis]|uniref:hydrogenase expression/formation protein HypE n=1 Tax=Risungbinella massiliensis TaxID=1329796 RepID=UPI0005CBEEFB|nr:hydrogenase expression/formation protein HypE [Risungbinella massiliensis]
MGHRISLAHGEGGELTHRLIKDVFVNSFGNMEQSKLDSAIFHHNDLQTIAVTTDSYVVKPIFFPGGNIGKLAITGTVNDLAVSGAKPQIITAGFIIEEGFLLSDLKKIVQSMAAEANNAGVQIIAGDTKVVEKGSADGLFINTTGLGIIRDKHELKFDSIRERDSVIISGTLGDHGISILSARQDLGLITEVQSDCASLYHLIQELMEKIDGIRIMRDPTRGGLTTTLIELCEDGKFNILLDEASIPIRKDVQGVCDILGFDPLYLANEGKVIIVVDSTSEQKVLDIMRKNPLGKDACVIGHITSCDEYSGKLLLKTSVGSTRRLYRLTEMLLPRIC